MLRLWLHHHHHHHHQHYCHFNYHLQQQQRRLGCRLLLQIPSFAPSLQQHRHSGRATLAATCDELVQKKSKGQKKREAIRAVDWALELSGFSDVQLRKAIKWGSLNEAVFDAIKIVKKIGRDGKGARRRQLNLVGGMLRSADPALMESVIKAIKSGDVEGVFSEHSEINSNVHREGMADEEATTEGESTADEEDTEEEDQNHVEDTAERWLQGLLSGDTDVSAEIYSIRSADFDRQELRRLVRDARSSQIRGEEKTDQDEHGAYDGIVSIMIKTEDKTMKLWKFLTDLVRSCN